MAVDRDVVIRIRTEILKAEGTPPDLQPLVKAQEQVKESAQAATEALMAQGVAGGDALDKITAATHQQLDALAQAVEAWRVVEGAARDYGNLQLKAAAGGDIPAMKEEETAAVDRHAAALEKENDARMDAQVAAAVEVTGREKALGVILEEEQAVKHSTQAHEVHGRSLLTMARPMTMVIHSTMHLAHSWALLTAANKEDEEQMTRSLMKYEGWIMGATGVLHLLHGLHMVYHIAASAAAAHAVATSASAAATTAAASAQSVEAGTATSAAAAVTVLAAAEGAEAVAATSAAVATWAFIAPLAVGAAAIAAVGFAIYRVGDAFDAWGTHVKKVEGDLKELLAVSEAVIAAHAKMRSDNFHAVQEGENKKREIREKTDPDRHPLMGNERIEEADAERAKIAAEKTALAKITKLAKDRQQRDTDDLEREQIKKMSPDARAGDHSKEKPEDIQKREIESNELLLRQNKELKELADQKARLEEQDAAAAMRKVDALARQRDHLRENLKTQRDIVKAAEDAVKAAQHKEDDANTHFGQLDEAKQIRLRRISAQVKKSGYASLNVHDLEALEQDGDEGIKHGAAEERRVRGVKSGLLADTDPLRLPGEKAGQEKKSAESQRSQAQREMGEMQKKLDKKDDELRAAGKTAMTAVDKVTKTTTDLINSLIAKIEELTKTLEAMRNNKPR